MNQPEEGSGCTGAVNMDHITLLSHVAQGDIMQNIKNIQNNTILTSLIHKFYSFNQDYLIVSNFFGHNIRIVHMEMINVIIIVRICDKYWIPGLKFKSAVDQCMC